MPSLVDRIKNHPRYNLSWLLSGCCLAVVRFAKPAIVNLVVDLRKCSCRLVHQPSGKLSKGETVLYRTYTLVNRARAIEKDDLDRLHTGVLQS